MSEKQKLTKEERRQKREELERKKALKKKIYIIAFIVALVVGTVLMVMTFINLNRLNDYPDDDYYEPTLNTKPSTNSGYEQIKYDLIENGSLVIYKPLTDIQITRRSQNVAVPITGVLNVNNGHFYETDNQQYPIEKFNKSGVSFAGKLYENSTVNDSFILCPLGEQTINTTYTLYGSLKLMEVKADSLKEVSMSLRRFDSFAIFDTGKFQITLNDSSVEKPVKIVISGRVEEETWVSLSYDLGAMTYRFLSNKNVYDLSMTVSVEGENDVVIGVDDGNYGADFILFGEPYARMKKMPQKIYYQSLRPEE